MDHLYKMQAMFDQLFYAGQERPDTPARSLPKRSVKLSIKESVKNRPKRSVKNRLKKRA